MNRINLFKLYFEQHLNSLFKMYFSGIASLFCILFFFKTAFKWQFVISFNKLDFLKKIVNLKYSTPDENDVVHAKKTNLANYWGKTFLVILINCSFQYDKGWDSEKDRVLCLLFWPSYSIVHWFTGINQIDSWSMEFIYNNILLISFL